MQRNVNLLRQLKATAIPALICTLVMPRDNKWNVTEAKWNKCLVMCRKLVWVRSGQRKRMGCMYYGCWQGRVSLSEADMNFKIHYLSCIADSNILMKIVWEQSEKVWLLTELFTFVLQRLLRAAAQRQWWALWQLESAGTGITVFCMLDVPCSVSVDPFVQFSLNVSN